MDVLLESINIRDLLPSHDLSPTSPLSAPDLRLLIHRLDSHSDHIKSKVKFYLLSHLSHFSALFDLSSSSVSLSDSLSADLGDLLALIGEGKDVCDEVRGIVEEVRVTMRELERRKEEDGVVRIVVDIWGKLGEVREVLRDGGENSSIVETAEKMRELKVALRIGEEGEGEEEVVVYELLRKEWSHCFEKIQERLAGFIGSMVRYEPQLGGIRVCSGGSGVDGVELRSVLEAMDVLGVLDYGLARTADLFIEHAIGPALNLKSPATFVVESNEGGNCEAVLQIVPCIDSGTNGLDGEAPFSRMIKVVNFMFEFICLQNGQWMRLFGKLTWPRMSDLIISNFLNKVVPDDASKLSDFQRIVNMSSEFENTLKKIMFISSSDNDDLRLSNFADNVETHFALRKKTEILAKARKLILQCDFTLPQDDTGSGCIVDLLFLSEKCMVSEAASQLMKLVHHTLKDVCLSSPRVALEFYHAARDALLFYGAIIPMKLDRQLDNINLAAVLVHNDCLYLSQEILGLAFEYRPHIPSCIKDHAVFVDMAPRLQLLAKEILQRHIQTVKVKLKEAIDAADGFQNTHVTKQYESAKLGLDQVVFILEKVHLIWEPVLLPSVYKASMCILLESVLSRISQDILLLDDIAAEETLQLQKLILLMLGNLSSLLESLASVKVGRSSENDGPPSLEQRIPSLRKIRKLAYLLDTPLKSITQDWESGELFSCGFNVTEVSDFIKAIFTDSPLRRDCLSRIQSSNV